MGIEAKSAERDVSAALVSEELRIFARKRWPLSNDKGHKALLQRALGFTHRRIKSLWEGEETAVPRTHETDAIERLIGKRIGAAADEENRDAFMALQARVARLEAALASLGATLVDDAVADEGEGVDGGRGEHVAIQFPPELHDQSKEWPGV